MLGFFLFVCLSFLLLFSFVFPGPSPQLITAAPARLSCQKLTAKSVQLEERGAAAEFSQQDIKDRPEIMQLSLSYTLNSLSLLPRASPLITGTALAFSISYFSQSGAISFYCVKSTAFLLSSMFSPTA